MDAAARPSLLLPNKLVIDQKALAKMPVAVPEMTQHAFDWFILEIVRFVFSIGLIVELDFPARHRIYTSHLDILVHEFLVPKLHRQTELDAVADQQLESAAALKTADVSLLQIDLNVEFVFNRGFVIAKVSLCAGPVLDGGLIVHVGSVKYQIVQKIGQLARAQLSFLADRILMPEREILNAVRDLIFFCEIFSQGGQVSPGLRKKTS